MGDAVAAFPAVYAGLDTSLLLDVYARGSERVRRALGGLSAEALRARPFAGKWSALEIALHLADAELVGAVRFRLVLGADEPALPGYDQDRWSREFRYGAADAAGLRGALDVFSALRASTHRLLSGASHGDWSRTGLHPEYGPVTLRNLLELYADHSERHVAQIVARRARLGAAIELPPLLPERLY